MECKSKRKLIEKEEQIELIDTLWNVNKKHPTGRPLQYHELIDPLCNVNSGIVTSSYTVN